MASYQTVRTQLRAATASAHARVDQVFSHFKLTNQESYCRFLQAQGGALIPLERALDSGIAPMLPIDWPTRRRSEALLRDLAALGHSAPEVENLPPIDDPAIALGTIYVLEGSRLGGVLLKRSVGVDLPASFFAPASAGSWQRMLQALEDLLPIERQRAIAIRAAEHAFGLFERSGRALLVEAMP